MDETTENPGTGDLMPAGMPDDISALVDSLDAPAASPVEDPALVGDAPAAPVSPVSPEDAPDYEGFFATLEDPATAGESLTRLINGVAQAHYGDGEGAVDELMASLGYVKAGSPDSEKTASPSGFDEDAFTSKLEQRLEAKYAERDRALVNLIEKLTAQSFNDSAGELLPKLAPVFAAQDRGFEVTRDMIAEALKAGGDAALDDPEGAVRKYFADKIIEHHRAAGNAPAPKPQFPDLYGVSLPGIGGKNTATHTLSDEEMLDRIVSK